MIHIIEGIDRVGKSTLRNMLVDAGFEYIESYISPDTLSDLEGTTLAKSLVYRERILAQLDVLKHLPTDKNYVLDRFHASQYAYSLAFRKFRDDLMEEVSATLAKLNAFVVYLYPTDIDKSSKEDGRDLHNVLDAIDDFRLHYEHCNNIACTYNDLTDIVTLLGGNNA